MDELSGDEALVFILSLAATACFGFIAPRALLRTTPLGGSRLRRLPLILAPALGIAALVYVLHHWAEPQVRDKEIYHDLFILLAVAWTGASTYLMFLLGLRIRADAIERRNRAATLAASGALLGQLLCYAGANIGGGATIWSTILPALLATGVWFTLWLILELLTCCSDAIALERDPASGSRLAGTLVALGLILGRAVAGDYVSAPDTLRDFAREAWPSLVVLLLAIAMQFFWRPTRRRPNPSAIPFGLLPGLLLIAAAAIYVLSLGSWSKS